MPLYHILKEIKKSIRNRYLDNNCNYGRYGFLSLQLSPLYHLEEGCKKAVETGIQKIVIMAPWILEPVVKPFFSSRRK